MAHRTNIQSIAKTFRFPPVVVEGMERVLALVMDDSGKPKYKSMTALVIAAIQELIKKERRVLEEEGVAWDHLGSSLNQTPNKEQNQ